MSTACSRPNEETADHGEGEPCKRKAEGWSQEFSLGVGGKDWRFMVWEVTRFCTQDG